MPVTYGSICSGIEAATAAWHGLGWRAAYFSEIEPFPSAVLAHHCPNVPNWGDFTNIKHAKIPVDVLVGGTPCQAFSVAGLRKSLDDDRGNLTLQFVELIHATPNLKCALWENVPGVLSTKDNAFGCFLGGLVGSDAALCSPDERGRWANSGMAAGPMGRVAWRVLDAQYFGVAQRRRRVFVIFSPTGSRIDCAKVLFESGGVRGDIATGGKARKETSGYALTGIAKYSEGLGTLRAAGGDLGGGSEVLVEAPPLSMCLNAGGMGRIDAESETLLPVTYGLAHMFKVRGGCGNGGKGYLGVDEESFTLSTTPDACNQASGMAIRKLTPVECERLQGFPDNYTNIKENCPDGPRYKALGNSMAVPVMAWIGARINQQIQEAKDMTKEVIDALLAINEDLVSQIDELKTTMDEMHESLVATKDAFDGAYAEFNVYLERNFQPGLYLPDDLRQVWESFQKIDEHIA